jgi:hypothetical protein
MDRIAKTFAIAISVACLGGCNMVITKEPMFTKANANVRQLIRPGIWREAIDNWTPLKTPGDEAVSLIHSA